MKRSDSKDQRGAPGALRQVRLVVRRSAATLLSVVVCSGALASEARWAFGVEPTVVHYESRERAINGAVLNTEVGRMPGLGLSLSRQWGGSPDGFGAGLGHAPGSPWANGDWRVGLHSLHAEGGIQYVGFSQIGLPVVTTTELSLIRTQIHGVRGWQAARHVRVEAGVLAEWQRLDRNIRPTVFSGNLQEIMRDRRVGLILGLVHRPGRASAFEGNAPIAGAAGSEPGGVSWSLGQAFAALVPSEWGGEVHVLRSQASTLEVNTFGAFDAISLSPAKSRDRRISLFARWILRPGVQWSIGASRQGFRPGASDVAIATRGGQSAATVRFPGADTRIRTANTQLKVDF